MHALPMIPLTERRDPQTTAHPRNDQSQCKLDGRRPGGRGQRKNSRHNMHQHCGSAPVLWHSATCCHTELRNLLTCAATISWMRCSRTSHGVSTWLQVVEAHRSLSSSVYAPRNPCMYQSAAHACSDNNKRRGNTQKSGGLDMLQPMVDRRQGQCTVLTGRVRHNTRQHANALLHVRTVLFAQSTMASDRSLQ